MVNQNEEFMFRIYRNDGIIDYRMVHMLLLVGGNSYICETLSKTRVKSDISYSSRDLAAILTTESYVAIYCSST